ncbi:MAG: hypothetical protein KDE53_07890 [Caldilineaceae bacterium]|nr:hypothetical protein [Caldilineaceae bacterium]
MQAPPEKLGSFYLGAEYDLRGSQRSDLAVNYDARDLTTHAVCVGMTGSGKTGLCLGLLEEAALDNVPAILVDPKGDLTNLLLQFPDLRPEDFRPWVNVDDARRKGQSVDEYAAATAALWRNGLADWGIDGERIRALQNTIDYTIFTPGSDAGVPINILGSLAAPGLDFAREGELIRERISGTVSALLGLVGVKADPVRSREAILLSNIFEHFWQANRDLDLAQLILAIQNPPVRQLGVFDVDTFFPQSDRFELAMAFNNLIAAPTFQSWLQGEPLDIDRLYFTADGKPRHSIFYIAHLSDSERMFFMTLLLEGIMTWVRRQSGTTSLRALLYIDEIFGYFPPTAEPPSKRPLLTLLKQARAFGLGVVLVTQNPVDIDYKGLTNAGTWFIGKLQAERDKARVLEGLKGAIAESGGDANVDYDDVITQLGSRVFLMHNVHAGRPVVFHTRWAMSYLRGPLTRPQVRDLMVARQGTPPSAPAAAPRSMTPQDLPASDRFVPAAPPAVGSAAAPAPAPVGPAVPHGFSIAPPALDPDVTQAYLPIVLNDQAALRYLIQETRRTIEPESIQLTYEPALIADYSLRFFDRKRSIDQQIDQLLLVPAAEGLGGVDWQSGERLSLAMRELRTAPERLPSEQGPYFAAAPESANSARELKGLAKELSDWLYYNSKLTIKVHNELDLFQMPGERERDFKIRLQQAAREQRDAEVDKLEEKLDRQIDRLQDKLRKEERDLAAEEAEHSARKQQEVIGIGESVLGWVLGRRSTRSLSTAANRRRMTAKAGQDVEETRQEIDDLKKEIAELELDLKEQVEDITVKWASLLDNLDTEEITPRRTDVDVRELLLAWLPSWVIRYQDGGRSTSDTVAAYQLPAVG